MALIGSFAAASFSAFARNTLARVGRSYDGVVVVSPIRTDLPFFVDDTEEVDVEAELVFAFVTVDPLAFVPADVAGLLVLPFVLPVLDLPAVVFDPLSLCFDCVSFKSPFLSPRSFFKLPFVPLPFVDAVTVDELDDVDVDDFPLFAEFVPVRDVLRPRD